MSRSLGVLVAVVVALVACGGGVAQAPACKRYAECIRALDARADRETDLDRFDPGGACWGSEEGATLCERACARGLELEASRRVDPPQECRP